MAKAKHEHSTRTTISSDPTFVAIEAHRKLDQVFLDLCRARDAGLATERAVERANDEAEKSAWKMARTEPTTAAGASAMLTYITTRPLTGLFELGETDWHETAFRTVVASLANITGQSAKAA
jgi:hypothetical protein